ncbi:MAG: hypothetical protein RLZZ15_667, partial [Verrucomicrobiota bacterium]
MNRRAFLKSSTAVATAATAASLSTLTSAAEKNSAAPRSAAAANKSSTAIAAYYLNAHMYTIVPAHVRADMEWMASIGTGYVCIGVLEQDLTAAYENHALIAAEAARVGMKMIAVPSRWAGLTAGAPK